MLTPFFDFGFIFWDHIQKLVNIQLDFQMQNFIKNIYKKSLEKRNTLEAHRTSNILEVAIISNIISLRFSVISRLFRDRPIRSKRISSNGKKNFPSYLQRESFYSRSKKNPNFVIYNNNNTEGERNRLTEIQ